MKKNKSKKWNFIPTFLPLCLKFYDLSTLFSIKSLFKKFSLEFFKKSSEFEFYKAKFYKSKFYKITFAALLKNKLSLKK